MIALLQRVAAARVEVDNNVVAQIDRGLLAFVGFEPQDDEAEVTRQLERILNYRLFSDADDKMNRSLRDIDGGLLLTPQFTLAADTTRGRRPSFTSAAPPVLGEQLFDFICQQARALHGKVASGRFGADMQVYLQNDGPVTFIIRSK